MKNLMKLSLALLTFSLLLTSCGESSKKGKWTSSDMNRCTADMISEMKAEKEVEAMLLLSGSTMDEFATCACEKIEGLYESESQASIALDGMSDEEAGMLILSCFGNLEDLMKLGEAELEKESADSEYGDGWSEEQGQDFINGCIGDDPDMELYCSCVLGNIMTEFEASDLEDWGDEDYEVIAERYSDCLLLISE